MNTILLFASAVLLCLATGIALGLLYAPEKGIDIRRKISYRCKKTFGIKQLINEEMPGIN